jgi:hypothetical protein
MMFQAQARETKHCIVWQELRMLRWRGNVEKMATDEGRIHLAYHPGYNEEQTEESTENI